MATFSDEKIAEWKALYKEHFNKEISTEEAVKSMSDLVRLMTLMSEPITEEQYQRVAARRVELGFPSLDAYVRFSDKE